MVKFFTLDPSIPIQRFSDQGRALRSVVAGPRSTTGSWAHEEAQRRRPPRKRNADAREWSAREQTLQNDDVGEQMVV